MEYRQKKDPPTKDGWYYGRWKAKGCKIIPRLVIDGLVQIPAEETPLKLDCYEWFGPVEEVREG